MQQAEIWEPGCRGAAGHPAGDRAPKGPFCTVWEQEPHGLTLSCGTTPAGTGGTGTGGPAAPPRRHSPPSTAAPPGSPPPPPSSVAAAASQRRGVKALPGALGRCRGLRWRQGEEGDFLPKAPRGWHPQPKAMLSQHQGVPVGERRMGWGLETASEPFPKGAGGRDAWEASPWPYNPGARGEAAPPVVPPEPQGS